jgi:uncharacterized membrane protein YgcG
MVSPDTPGEKGANRSSPGTVLPNCGNLGVLLHAQGFVDLFHARAFGLGLAYGGVAFFAAMLVGLLARGRRRNLDFAALAFVAAAWFGVRGAWGSVLASQSIAVALIVLALGGASVHLVARLVPGAHDHPLAVSAAAIAPGAALLAVATPLAGSAYARILMALATVVAAVAIRDFDAMKGDHGAPWMLIAISAAGVYLAVPDTELARVLLGVALPFVLLSIPNALSPIGPAGSAAVAGVFTWVIFVGGRGRPGSVVGGLATLGILLAEPVGRRWVGALMTRKTLLPQRGSRPPKDEYLLAAAVAAIAQIALMLYSSRIVAKQDSVLRALLELAPVAALAVFCAPMLYPEAPVHVPHRPSSGRGRSSSSSSSSASSRRSSSSGSHSSRGHSPGGHHHPGGSSRRRRS